MKNSKCLIIVPIYNEYDNIDFIVNDLSKTSHDVLFIDDCSTDNSYQRLLSLGLNVIHLSVNLGIGGCVQTGYLYAFNHNYDMAIQYDGDGQHCLEYVDSLIEGINEGYDYVIGSRYIDQNNAGFQSSHARRIGIKILSTIIKVMTGKRVLDVTSGFRAINKDVIECFCRYYPDDYPEPEVVGLLLKDGYKVQERHVLMRDRHQGASSIKVFKSIYYMVKVALSIIIMSSRYAKKELS